MVITILDSGYSGNAYEKVIGGVSIEERDGKIIYKNEYFDTSGHGTAVTDLLLSQCEDDVKVYVICILDNEERCSSNQMNNSYLILSLVIFLLVLYTCLYIYYRKRKKKIINVKLQKSRIEILREYKEYDVDHEEIRYGYSFTMNNEVPKLLEKYSYSEYMKGISPESDDFVFQLLNFVSEHFQHNGETSLPHNHRMVDIIEAYEQNGKKTNCRGLSLILAELLRINGIKARHVTCKPFEEPFNDCHVVVDCILPSGKRIMLDPTMRLYFKNKQGEFVSIEHFRKGLIEGEIFFENKEASYNGEKFDRVWYMEYMSKNLFRFSASLDNADVRREDERREVELIPRDYQIKGFPRWKVFVYNPLSFWKI